MGLGVTILLRGTVAACRITGLYCFLGL